VKLSDYIFSTLKAMGVGHVFTLPGGGAMHLVDSLGASGIPYVCNLHEQASAICAEAYGRATNRLGVALVTSGPGGTNALTGTAGAWFASTPCLFLSGQVKRADLKGLSGVRQRGPQEIDIVAMAGPITKYAVTVTDPATIRFHLEKAIHLATTGRKGPVWLDLPLDVQGADIDPGALEGFVPEAGAAGPDLAGQVAEALRLLAGSERPVLLAGNGVHFSGMEAPFLALAERLGIPVLTTWMGCDLIPDEHPLFFGRPGTIASRGANFTVQNADCLISLGVRLDFDVTGYDQSRYARGARKIVVDVDPAELGKLGMRVDLPICADLGAVIPELLRQAGAPGERGPWLARCRDWKARYPVIRPEYREPSDRINPFVFAEVLSGELAAGDLIVPGSSGMAIDMFWMAYRSKTGQRAFSTGGLGAMGFGVPAGLGACLALGGRRTVTVDGDGGFLMNIQELATIARLGLPVKFFVGNNQGYASIRTMQRNHFQGRLVACDGPSGLALPDIVAVAQSMGLPALRVDGRDDLGARIRQVLEHPGPFVCDVLMDPAFTTSPRMSTVVKPDGAMASRPLEDLWPFLDRDEFRANMLIPVLED